jgi:3-methylcrotonyl-CoA carboxylase alpha subunit
MGIDTVAVYSDVDRRSRHVRIAGEAFNIGGAAAADSYLKSDAILEVAKNSGAEAIHPGYGFLSENADFAEACKKSGIVFIGPSSKAITAMGLKDKAKEIMKKAGVPVVPGYLGDKQDNDYLKSQADQIGYPVLIKAVAGGGGKGMRLVNASNEFVEALNSCKREAKASFANDHVLIEKYITEPRHIEMQVFGDSHGNAVHLFERDCSLQRRHQKVVEESPAPGLPDEVREAMGDAAVKAVQALEYENAGTIEFIVDSESFEFFFMEMNTRLQVEHPVTEMVTGKDLVELQLRIAGGEAIPFSQDELSIYGHAFEARIYAEDPANDFLPQTGRVAYFSFPSDVRMDSAVDQGDSVTIHYDPMISKLIVWDKSREAAILKMQTALKNTVIAGINTNQEFLANIFASEDFIAGKVNTDFIPEHEADLLPRSYGKAGDAELALAAIYLVAGLGRRGSKFDPWDECDNWRMGTALERQITFINKGDRLEVTISGSGSKYVLKVGDKELTVTDFSLQGRRLTITLDGKKLEGLISVSGADITIFYGGRVISLHRFVHGIDDDEGAGEGRIITPMPGKIVDVLVNLGEEVSKDQPLMIMEAMKMEMTIRASCDGAIDELPVSKGDQVADGVLLISIEQKDAA